MTSTECALGELEAQARGGRIAAIAWLARGVDRRVYPGGRPGGSPGHLQDHLRVMRRGEVLGIPGANADTQRESGPASSG